MQAECRQIGQWSALLLGPRMLKQGGQAQGLQAMHTEGNCLSKVVPAQNMHLTQPDRQRCTLHDCGAHG